MTPLLAAVLALAPAHAVRPTEGGMWSFDPADVVESWDEATETVRVHYSIDGPNKVLMTDSDEDGVPDFAQMVAETAADVILYYENTTGLRRPLSEEDMGLSALGGSYAFDFYLVDFGGNADGLFGQDACDGSPGHCSGYMVMENDFKGYGYPSTQAAVDVLTSHELFHAVQAAYDAGQEVWFSEGTAVWGERQYDPDSIDFIWFASAYLADAGRSLDKPPSGPVPTFAYATCLWWDFLTNRHDIDLMLDLLDSTEGGSSDLLTDMVILLEARGDTIEDAWTTFASYNLASGDRSGAMDGHPYASRLGEVVSEAEGDAIDDDNRFYPLATTYYRLDHGGGPIWFGLEEEAPEVYFALHAVEGGGDDGPVLEAVDSWTGAEAEARALADGAELDPGGYWLVGTQAAPSDGSVKVRFCLGSQDTATACAPADTGTDTGDTGAEDPGGCSCATGSAPALAWLLILMPALARRRR